MGNPFDQFDAQPSGGNPFDQFDGHQQGQQPEPDLTRAPPDAARNELTKEKAWLASQLKSLPPAAQKVGWDHFNNDPHIQALTKAATPPDSSRLRGLVLGIEKPLDNLTSLAMHIPGMATLDRWGQAIGLPSAAAATAEHDAGRQNNTRTGYQTAGNIIGTAPTLALPGGIAAQGAASGALLSDHKDISGVATDAGMGALTSVAGGALLRGAGKLAKPITDKAAVALHDAGVQLSPGQLMQAGGSTFGKAVRGMEDKARSTPILGSLIGGSRDRATTQLNQAVANNALAPIGQAVPTTIAAGHDLLDHVESQLSQKYQEVVPKLVGHMDQQFATDLAGAKATTNVLPADKQQQFQSILRDVFENRTNGSTISGQNLKDAESRLTLLAGKYSRSPDADQQILGQSLSQVRGALRDLAARSDPSGGELQAINTGWARLKQMQSAANTNGIILPGALARSANKSGFGTDLARAASSLLPDHVPNSGTADRMLLAKLAEAAGGGGVGAAAVTGHPAAAGGATLAALLAAAPYTKIGQSVLNRAAFAQRPQVVQKAGSLAQLLAKGAPVAVPALRAHRTGP